MIQSPKNKIKFQEKKKTNKDKKVEINRVKTEKRKTNTHKNKQTNKKERGTKKTNK